MTPYYCNEAMLELPNVASLVDLTRQYLQIVTQDGAELELAIERARATAGQSLTSFVEAGLAERRRSLRGFELVSLTQCEYPDVRGIEARLTFVDKERGPRFVHEFHCALDTRWIVYQGTSRLPHAAHCDEWMRTVVKSLKLR
jgi:hypothetical protein